jgi:hypothetical protein
MSFFGSVARYVAKRATWQAIREANREEKEKRCHIRRLFRSFYANVFTTLL